MSEEFALVAPNADTRPHRRRKPTLMAVDGRFMASDGRWHPELVAEYINDHGGRQRWIPIDEIARVFYHANNASNRVRVRERFHIVWRVLLERHVLAVIDFDSREGAKAIKVYNPNSVEEREQLNARLQRMERQKLLKTDQLDRAYKLAQIIEAEV